MSSIAQLLNAWLRRVEKPALARAKDPKDMRRRFERNARFFFHGPLGTKKIWHKWPVEGRLLEVLELVPPDETDAAVLFYIHGGGFVFGSPNTHAALLAQIARRTKLRALLPRYSLAPEAPFPAALDDVRAAWDKLSADPSRPKRIVLGGDSAGGALALSLLGTLLADGAALPQAVFCFSPLTDMSFSGESFRTNAGVEAVLPSERADEMVQMYVGACAIDDPRVSPLFADFSGAPPIWISVGNTEILADDARRMVARIRAQGVAVHFEEAADLPHVWPIFHNILPEARESLDFLADWLKQLLDLPIEN
ncbi:MAG: alpha/beta hydrolase [Pseudomonadota bacterium]